MRYGIVTFKSISGYKNEAISPINLTNLLIFNTPYRNYELSVQVCI